MKILLTGSSGRIGRAIFGALAAAHEVVGLDRSPFATTRIIADVTDHQAVVRAVQGVDAVIHTAALHAPHVGLVPDAVFQQINVDATAHLLQAARKAGARRFVLTSTTALYGHAVVAGDAAGSMRIPSRCRERSTIAASCRPRPWLKLPPHRTSGCACCGWGAASRNRRNGWRCSGCIVGSTPVTWPVPMPRCCWMRGRPSPATSPAPQPRSGARIAWNWPPSRATYWPGAYRSCWPSSSAAAGHCR